MKRENVIGWFRSWFAAFMGGSFVEAVNPSFTIWYHTAWCCAFIFSLAVYINLVHRED
jgi:hypothetical protein